MGTGEAQLTGPDLTQGIPLDALAPGGKLLGHAFGDPVLLVRLEHTDENTVAEYAAIGASCTHYGGPLVEGVIEHGAVRCPWHHACFDLKTGEALRAPALSPVACYEVQRTGDRVVVTRKLERDPLSPTYPLRRTATVHPQQVAIIGAGAAGVAAAEMLRRCGYGGRITMIDPEPDAPYDRPNLSKDYLSGNAPEEWIPLRPPGFYEEHGIAFVRARATRIDLARRVVEVGGQTPVAYDALLLATGAEPVHLGLPGDDLPHVHYLRSLADSRAIIAALGGASRAVVIGGSFIGLEVAAALRTRGLEVHVVAPEPVPLERVLGPALGAFVRSVHERHGVVFHLGRTPAQIEHDVVVLDDGSRLTADVVVIGVGVRPRLTLAQDAGLSMDRGIAVDEFLETSAPGVYAAGDIARWPDPHTGERIRVEHWVVAERMGQTAARNILGARERFDQVPFFWSAHYDVSINYVGHAERWDVLQADGDIAAGDAAVGFLLAGKRLALATVSRDTASLEAEIAMERASAV